MILTNTLAYYCTELITVVKSFIVQVKAFLFYPTGENEVISQSVCHCKSLYLQTRNTNIFSIGPSFSFKTLFGELTSKLESFHFPQSNICGQGIGTKSFRLQTLSFLYHYGENEVVSQSVFHFHPSLIFVGKALERKVLQYRPQLFFLSKGRIKQ